jgi:hypothetical protein
VLIIAYDSISFYRYSAGDIPRKFHSKVKPFLKQDLDMDISIKGSYLVITLTPAKTTKSNMATTEIFRLSGWDEID